MKEFIEATELALSTTYFQFKDIFYKQVFGCAMGAPISSVIAQLVLEDLEKKVISELSFKPIFFKRYVDDCIACVPCDKVEYFLKQFNDYHPKLQFTVEIEENSSINFLDLTLIRNNSRIQTKFFQKPISSGRYVNYFSNQPLTHKKNVVSALADRAIQLTSAIFRPEIINKIKNVLIENNYPVTFIDSIFKGRLHKYYNKSKFKNKNEKNEKCKYIPLPYVNQLSERLDKILAPYNFKIAHKNYNNLKFTSSYIKDKVPVSKQTHIVYKIPCKDCQSVYIGQTMQHLNDRLNGHKYSKNITALKKHINQTKHSFNFDNTKIINKEFNCRAREILELINIKKHPNAVNDRNEISKITTSYYSIL